MFSAEAVVTTAAAAIAHLSRKGDQIPEKRTEAPRTRQSRETTTAARAATRPSAATNTANPTRTITPAARSMLSMSSAGPVVSAGAGCARYQPNSATPGSRRQSASAPHR
jgi:hypothetical protein